MNKSDNHRIYREGTPPDHGQQMEQQARQRAEADRAEATKKHEPEPQKGGGVLGALRRVVSPFVTFDPKDEAPPPPQDDHDEHTEAHRAPPSHPHGPHDHDHSHVEEGPDLNPQTQTQPLTLDELSALRKQVREWMGIESLPALAALAGIQESKAMRRIQDAGERLLSSLDLLGEREKEPFLPIQIRLAAEAALKKLGTSRNAAAQRAEQRHQTLIADRQARETSLRQKIAEDQAKITALQAEIDKNKLMLTSLDRFQAEAEAMIQRDQRALEGLVQAEIEQLQMIVTATKENEAAAQKGPGQ